MQATMPKPMLEPKQISGTEPQIRPSTLPSTQPGNKSVNPKTRESSPISELYPTKIDHTAKSQSRMNDPISSDSSYANPLDAILLSENNSGIDKPIERIIADRTISSSPPIETCQKSENPKTERLSQEKARREAFRNLTEQLAAPFDGRLIKFKPQSVKGNRALVVAYVDVRTIQDRLDEILGVENWQDEYEVLPDLSVICRLKIRIRRQWITKMDVGSPSDSSDSGDRMKAGFSDALKRAAVKFGIGRYLYRTKQIWVDYNPATKKISTPIHDLLTMIHTDSVRQNTENTSSNPKTSTAINAVPLSSRSTPSNTVPNRPSSPPIQAINNTPAKTPPPVEMRNSPKSDQNNKPQPIAPEMSPTADSQALSDKSLEASKQILQQTNSNTKPMEKNSPMKETRRSESDIHKNKSSHLPQTAAELHYRLQDKDTKLAAAGRCKVGQLLNAVLQAGIKKGFGEDITRWSEDGIEFAFEFAKEYIEKLPAVSLPNKVA